MATLTLTIGQLSASKAVDNTKATAVLLAYAEAIGATGTNSQKLEAVVNALARHMTDTAQGHARRKARVEAEAALADTLTNTEMS